MEGTEDLIWLPFRGGDVAGWDHIGAILPCHRNVGGLHGCVTVNRIRAVIAVGIYGAVFPGDRRENLGRTPMDHLKPSTKALDLFVERFQMSDELWSAMWTGGPEEGGIEDEERVELVAGCRRGIPGRIVGDPEISPKPYNRAHSEIVTGLVRGSVTWRRR